MAQSRYKNGDGSINRAREMRRDGTPAERILWAALRGRGVGRLKFRRQQRLGPYFADFVCQSMRLVVEVDGDTHAHSVEYDQRRTAFLASEGYRVIRFTNAEVLTNLEGVILAIERAVVPSPSHPAAPGGPLPLPQGERS